MFFYSYVETTNLSSIIIVVASAIIAIAAATRPGLKFLNLAATVCDVLLAWVLVQSVSGQLDPLGW